ncbi:hypothetical protein J4223_02220 [Candidatus Woesearchaeota archaeon]|nr:hypothetical protein [Candidatus Woesearchaeota archaeon]
MEDIFEINGNTYSVGDNGLWYVNGKPERHRFVGSAFSDDGLVGIMEQIGKGKVRNFVPYFKQGNHAIAVVGARTELCLDEKKLELDFNKKYAVHITAPIEISYCDLRIGEARVE